VSCQPIDLATDMLIKILEVEREQATTLTRVDHLGTFQTWIRSQERMSSVSSRASHSYPQVLTPMRRSEARSFL
jgi:antibiotic biosynthesis monooxygenase (ABM) superfamily enzyme